jgi:hypothetical protein
MFYENLEIVSSMAQTNKQLGEGNANYSGLISEYCTHMLKDSIVIYSYIKLMHVNKVIFLKTK